MTTITPVDFLPPLGLVPTNAGSAASSTKGFESLFVSEMQKVNGQMMQADASLQAFTMGSGESVHDVMLSMEQARLSFQLMVQVRNKLLEGYQDILRMQI